MRLNSKPSVATEDDVANWFRQRMIENGERVDEVKVATLTYLAYVWFLVEKDNELRLFDNDFYATPIGPMTGKAWEKYLAAIELRGINTEPETLY